MYMRTDAVLLYSPCARKQLMMCIKHWKFDFEALRAVKKKKKKNYFDAQKTYFIILSHYFTISYLSDVLFFNSIH